MVWRRHCATRGVEIAGIESTFLIGHLDRFYIGLCICVVCSISTRNKVIYKKVTFNVCKYYYHHCAN